MSSTLRFALAGVALIGLVVFFSAMFVVPQTAQALVFQFGRVARPPITQPGLYFKWPIIENVIEIDKRILDLELPTQEVIASDQKRLVVDAFTRYRVTDPLRFYQSVDNVAGANMRLTSIVNSAVRTVLAEANFAAVVRTDRSRAHAAHPRRREPPGKRPRHRGGGRPHSPRRLAGAEQPGGVPAHADGAPARSCRHSARRARSSRRPSRREPTAK